MNVKPNQQEGINPWDQKHHLHHIVNPCVYGMQFHRGCRPWELEMQNWSANNPFIASDRSWWIARTELWPPGGKLGSVWEKRWQVGESSLSQHCPCCHGYPELACHKSHVGIYSVFLENHQHCPADLTTSALQSWQKLSNMHTHSNGHKLQKTSSWFRSSKISFFTDCCTLWKQCGENASKLPLPTESLRSIWLPIVTRYPKP